jgi:hypothetical protein
MEKPSPFGISRNVIHYFPILTPGWHTTTIWKIREE